MPWPRGVTAAYAFEDGALKTFERATRRQMVRIWDLPLPHWATLERMWRREAARWPGSMGATPPVEPEWKRKRKDEELALADVVSVASSFTRRSLEEIGCKKPVIVTPYGFPVDRFASKDRPTEGPFTVLAVGTQDLRKGTPYLLEAWKHAGIKDARLRLVGPMRLTVDFLAPRSGLFEHVPYLPKASLEREYQAADVLAFPTLGDGFGLVMQEAMCCRTPVMTTPRGGGPECITNGVEGWILPEGNLEALVECLRWAARDRDSIWEMGKAARRRAEGWTWKEAGDHFVAQLLRYCE
jgi:glycosyltransferase involved in cell wall biosynthesis